MNSDARNSGLVQVLMSLKNLKSLLYLRHDKVIHIKKRRKILPFLSIFYLDQTSKNKIVTENNIISSIQYI